MERTYLSGFDDGTWIGILLPVRNMRGLALKAAGRRLSESRMSENRPVELTAKPHVRFDVAGDENQTW
jgi:hypothetical protein